jgi:hypothetical protein
MECADRERVRDRTIAALTANNELSKVQLLCWAFLGGCEELIGA